MVSNTWKQWLDITSCFKRKHEYMYFFFSSFQKHNWLIRIHSSCKPLSETYCFMLQNFKLSSLQVLNFRWKYKEIHLADVLCTIHEDCACWIHQYSTAISEIQVSACGLLGDETQVTCFRTQASNKMHFTELF